MEEMCRIHYTGLKQGWGIVALPLLKGELEGVLIQNTNLTISWELKPDCLSNLLQPF